jgi:hypothetical protein
MHEELSVFTRDFRKEKARAAQTPVEALVFFGWLCSRILCAVTI